MASPKVSCILPTYNRPNFLVRALMSIEAQDFKDYEVVVINDGGEDVSRYTQWFSNIRYMNNVSNCGLPAARNVGLRAATGKYIAYLDDDDMWLPFHLSTLVNTLEAVENYAIETAYTDTYFWFDESRLEVLLSIDYSRAFLHEHNVSPIISFMHTRRVLNECGGFSEQLRNHEDYDLWLRMSEFTDFIHVPKVTALYSKRSDGTQMSSDVVEMAMGFHHVRMINNAA